MSQHAEAKWLVCYDISDRKNWARVFQLLKKHGVPLQYSVFMLTTHAATIGSLAAQITSMINPKTDDIRIYRLAENAWTYTAGSAIIPADMLIGL